MTKQRKTTLLIVLGIALMVSLSDEFAKMATEGSFPDALATFVITILIVVGAVYWIKSSKK